MCSKQVGLGKVIQMNQLDATMIYWSIGSAQHVSGNLLPIIRSVRLRFLQHMVSCSCGGQGDGERQCGALCHAATHRLPAHHKNRIPYAVKISVSSVLLYLIDDAWSNRNQDGIACRFQIKYDRVMVMVHGSQVGERHFWSMSNQESDTWLEKTECYWSRTRTNVFSTSALKWSKLEVDVKNWMTDWNFFVYKNDLLCSEKMGSCMLCHWLLLDSLLMLQIHEEACISYVFWNYSSTDCTSWIQKRFFNFKTSWLLLGRNYVFMNLSLKCE